ncbi:MAG: hypothetical protein ACTHNQ_11040 [Microbacterium sp.]|uniref:hypothetical protein n=1 Tax=Microbacterium sp. TaxID=51671 RepID=UPI003F7E9726
MSTFENPDAAPDADATPETADTQATTLPPVPETAAADAARSAETAQSDELTPTAAGHVTEASTVVDLTPPAATDADETSVLADLEPPAPAPAALPPAFTGFPPAPDATSAPVAPGAAPVATASTIPSGPRTRWAGIVWGLALAAIASFALWLLTDVDRQAAATDWILSLTPAAAIAYSVLVIGAFALAAGLVGLVRRAQRAGERRRAASALTP